MRSETDWAYIRKRTLMPVLSVVITALLLVAAIHVRDRQQAVLAELDANQLAAQEDYNALVVRRRLLDRYHERYRLLHAQGFVGQESRLDWVETIRAATTNLTLPRLSYALAPQLSVASPVSSTLAGESIGVHMSRLELELALLHEWDLLRFMDSLKQQAPGLMRVRGCHMQWQSESGRPTTLKSNITTRCDLEIFSVITSDVRREATSR